MKIGKYIIEDWEEHGKHNARRKIFLVDKPTIEGYFISVIDIAGSNKPARLILQFYSPDKLMGGLHRDMFGEGYYFFSSKEEAMNHADLFLNKLQKLKAFL